MFFNKLYKVEYWSTDVISRDNILTVIKARDMAHVVKKLERKHYPHTVGIISIERIGK